MSVRVGQLWHYPVKSMQGEPTDEVILGPGGVVGDRAYGFVDVEAGRLISAKHPKRYAAILECRAACTEPPQLDADLPPVRVTFPDGVTVDGDHDEITPRVGKLLGCEARLATVAVDAGPRIHIVASTLRCIMTTLGQADLTRDPEVLRTMARSNRRPFGEFGLFPTAGAYAEVVTPGAVRV